MWRFGVTTSKSFFFFYIYIYIYIYIGFKWRGPRFESGVVLTWLSSHLRLIIGRSPVSSDFGLKWRCDLKVFVLLDTPTSYGLGVGVCGASA